MKKNTWMLVEAGMMIALAVILGELIVLFKMPMGGSVTLGGMVPLFIFAYRWGGKHGMNAGALWAAGLHNRVLPDAPCSTYVDYPLAFAMTGLAGFSKTAAGYVGGMFTVYSRDSSATSFPESYSMPAMRRKGRPAVYSILYNGTFLLPELVISGIITLIIVKFARLPEPKKQADWDQRGRDCIKEARIESEAKLSNLYTTDKIITGAVLWQTACHIGRR